MKNVEDIYEKRSLVNNMQKTAIHIIAPTNLEPYVVKGLETPSKRYVL